MMDKFLELLQQSVIVQALLTLMVWGGIIYMYVTGQTPSDVLVAAGSVILGFYFGAKTQLAITNRG